MVAAAPGSDAIKSRVARLVRRAVRARSATGDESLVWRIEHDPHFARSRAAAKPIQLPLTSVCGARLFYSLAASAACGAWASHSTVGASSLALPSPRHERWKLGCRVYPCRIASEHLTHPWRNYARRSPGAQSKC